MLKKASSFVLASLKASTSWVPVDPDMQRVTACRSLRPRLGKGRVLARLGWAGETKAFLTILDGVLRSLRSVQTFLADEHHSGYSTRAS